MTSRVQTSRFSRARPTCPASPTHSNNGGSPFPSKRGQSRRADPFLRTSIELLFGLGITLSAPQRIERRIEAHPVHQDRMILDREHELVASPVELAQRGV